MFKLTIQNNWALVISLCLWCLGSTLLLPDKIFAREGEEYAVKAAFILNFAKVTIWPEKVFIDSPATIDVGLVGDDELLAMAFRSIDGKQVGDRILRVRLMPTAADCRGCEILFVSNAIERATLLRFLTAVKDRPVLLIGETPDFARIGGIINFISKNGRLHFEINPQEAERHRLKISSRILQLASIVE
ncbi:MAG: YfiR family protein [Desulfocapsaceae bacterium]|nr:YfiR family protein [Desulfocapsaceae bacterium]